MLVFTFFLLLIREGCCSLDSTVASAAHAASSSTAQVASDASYDIAKRIATRAKNAIEEGSWGYYKNFGTWNYEGAMVYRGLWEIQSALKEHADFDIEPFLHDRLNFYQVSS